jgi:hypothetical protein
MTKKSVVATLLFGALVASAPAGCSRFKPSGPDAMGTVTFMLSAMGASGTVYRLRSTMFMLSGPETKTINGPTDPADTSTAITSQLRPGLYQLTLGTGWQMWKIPTAGAPVMVAATLISPATLSFAVTSGQDSKVNFQFDVAADGQVPGTLTIGIGVTEVMDGGADGAAGTTGAAGAGASGGAGAAGGAAGAAGGTAGAAGASTCGNGVVETGEQCDNAAAFANHTCDQTTCQSIPIVCGNHLVQPGEQCDDGPSGSATCTATCTTVSASSTCTQCEKDGTTAGNCIGTKVDNSLPAFGCAGLAAADIPKCMTLLNCLQTHPNCSIGGDHTALSDDPTDCFCGALTITNCNGAPAASIAGQCASAYFALYGGVTDANRALILGDFFNRMKPIGMANNLYACDVDNSCQSQCP